MPPSPAKLIGRFGVDTGVGNFLGDTRIRLLEQIERHGSISQAAKAVPLSYKAAWDAIDSMNNLAPEPLVVRTTGGRHGGGSALTDYGKRLVAFYRALEAEYQGAIDRLAGSIDGDAAGDVRGFRQLLRRLSTKASARNQFAGPISQIVQGAVDCEVTLDLGDGLTLTALVTRESALTLGFTVGTEAMAFVKSSSILLVEDAEVKISARNRLRGVVERLHEGPVNTEVTVAISGARHMVTAVITGDSAQRMGLAVGMPVMAAFKASSVFLLTLD